MIAGVDARIVQTLNGWFAGSSLRADLARTLAIAPLFAIVFMMAFAWGSRTSSAPERRSYLVVGILGGLAALLLNVGLGHFYYRPRPFLELNVRALLPKPADSSLFSDHAAIAASLTAGLVLAHRRIGAAAVGLLVLVGVGRVGVAVQYPTDVLVGGAAGVLGFVAFLPARGVIARLIEAGLTGKVSQSPSKPPGLLERHRRVFGTLALITVAAAGYGARALEDHGRVAEANRLESFYRRTPPAQPPLEFALTPVATIAGGHFRSTHATIVGDVTQVTRELDGDIHLRIEGPGAFIVAEIMPELPLSPPHIGERITAWGIVRHDGLHNWWELHPLVGWRPGTVVSFQPPLGGGD